MTTKLQPKELKAAGARFGVLIAFFLGSCFAFPMFVLFVPWPAFLPPTFQNLLFFWPQHAIPNAWDFGDVHVRRWSLWVIGWSFWVAVFVGAAWLSRGWRLRNVALAALPGTWLIMRVVHGILGLFGARVVLDSL